MAALTSEHIKARARHLGFDLCGIAPAESFPELGYLREWLDRGYAGEMAYMSRTAERRADARAVVPGARSVIVTGSATGKPPNAADVQEAKSHCRLPVFLGSGITENNIADFYDAADGFIIGSAFKIDGLWSNTVDPVRVTGFLRAIHRAP